MRRRAGGRSGAAQGERRPGRAAPWGGVRAQGWGRAWGEDEGEGGGARRGTAGQSGRCVGGRTCASSKIWSSASVNKPIFLRVGQLACLSGSALLSAGCCEGKVGTGDGCWVELDVWPLTRSGVFSLDDLI